MPGNKKLHSPAPQLLIAFALCLTGLMGIDVAHARSIAIPTDSTNAARRSDYELLLNVCDALVEKGFVSGYAADFFDGDKLVSDWAFEDFVVSLFEQTAEMDSDQVVVENISLSSAREFLYEVFSEELTPVRVELRQAHSFRGDPFGEKMLELCSQAGVSLEEVRQTRAQAEKDDKAISSQLDQSSQKSPYLDVPFECSAYARLQRLCTLGILEGYPENFFDGSRGLTRYEFAQAVARLLDTVVSNSDLVGADHDTAHEVVIDMIYLEALFRDQWAELSHQIEGMDGNLLQHE